ncbi:MAG: YggT family protein [Pseudomonadota bacterium]
MLSSINIILQFVFHLACMLFIVRFLLQASQADFYNPISQAIVKATDPVCAPIRKILPGFKNLDFTSILVAWLVAAIGIYAVTYINYGSGPTLASAAWVGLIEMLMVLIQFYQFSLLIVVIASFLAQGSYHPALALLHQLMEPLLGPIRRILPSLGPLDLSPMVLFLIIIVVQNLLAQSMPRML